MMQRHEGNTIIHIQNNLLSRLRAEDLALLRPSLKELNVKTGQILYEAGDVVRYAYFPCDATILSFMVFLADAKGVEAALIGREGALGGIVSQGNLPAYCRAIVQHEGPVLRIETKALEEAKLQSITLRHIFARYSDCLIAQVFQSVACNAMHSIEQRTAKWLLAAIDRTGEKVLPLTQEHLASMLGIGRSYVARVISKLKAQGILETSRGKFEVKDFKRMEKISCDCNKLVQAHFDNVLSGTYPSGSKKS